MHRRSPLAAFLVSVLAMLPGASPAPGQEYQVENLLAVAHSIRLNAGEEKGWSFQLAQAGRPLLWVRACTNRGGWRDEVHYGLRLRCDDQELTPDTVDLVNKKGIQTAIEGKPAHPVFDSRAGAWAFWNGRYDCLPHRPQEGKSYPSWPMVRGLWLANKYELLLRLPELPAGEHTLTLVAGAGSDVTVQALCLLPPRVLIASTADWQTTIYADQAPRLDELPETPLKVRVGAGHSDPAAFSLFSLVALADVSVRLEPCEALIPEGQPLPAEVLSLYEITPLAPIPESPNDWCRYEPFQVEGWLKHDGRIMRSVTGPLGSFAAKSRRRFLVDIDREAALDPGCYLGAVAVREGGETLCRLPLEIYVYPEHVLYDPGPGRLARIPRVRFGVDAHRQVSQMEGELRRLETYLRQRGGIAPSSDNLYALGKAFQTIAGKAGGQDKLGRWESVRDAEIALDLLYFGDYLVAQIKVNAMRLAAESRLNQIEDADDVLADDDDDGVGFALDEAKPEKAFDSSRLSAEQSRDLKGKLEAPINVKTARPTVLVHRPQRWATQRRGPRVVTPFRTLLRSPALSAVQVQTPQRIFPLDRFDFAEQVQPIAVRMAGWEYEDAQFAVDFENPDDVLALEVEVTPPTGPKGALLRGCELREVLYVPRRRTRDPNKWPAGHYPGPLLPCGWYKQVANPEASILRNAKFYRGIKRRVFYVILQTPPDAAPGMYEGAVRLSLHGEPVGAIPLAVQVDPFSLPKRPALRCYSCTVSYGGWPYWAEHMREMGFAEDWIASFRKEKSIRNRYRERMLAYGWTSLGWSTGIADWEAYHDYGRGINVFQVGGSGNREAEEWLKRHKLLEYSFVYGPIDEHSNGEVPEVAEWCRKWKLESDIPIFDCFYHDNVEPLFGLVDVWLGQWPMANHWGESTGPLGWGAKAVERKKRGDQFFACNGNALWEIERETLAGRREFWRDFYVGYDGHYYFSTWRWAVTHDLYGEAGADMMGNAIYPSPDGVATSIRLENIRDGIEDYDYLVLLKAAVQAASGVAVEEAEAILGDPELYKGIQSVEQLRALRAKIADLIIALQAHEEGSAQGLAP